MEARICAETARILGDGTNGDSVTYESHQSQYDYNGDGINETYNCTGGIWRTLEGVYDGTPPPPLTGDLNNDGRVDIFDLVIVGTSFGRSPGQSGYDSRADANNSGGAIDIFDLILVGSHFGEGG